jgi:TonB family protein
MKLTATGILLTIASFSFQQANGQHINKKLARQLVAIYQADQQYRVAAIAAAKKFGAGSPLDKAMMMKQDSADLVNLGKIEKIITRYGYPGKSLVGAQSKVAFMVVQHNDLEPQEKYLPLFMKAAEKGELDRTLLPLMIDRVRVAKGQQQLYGTQLSETKDKQIQIKPIEDEINVDVRRKAAGLPPLADYYKSWGISYQVPTAAGNLNPKELYYNKDEREEPSIEAVGGDKAIFTKLHYPEKAQSNNITGFVIIQYTVDKDGNTTNISVVKGLGYDCDEEAIRVIKETKYINKTGEESELRMKLPFPYNK